MAKTKKLGQMMNGGNRGNRQSGDFYATPPDCTLALVQQETSSLANYDRIWEPACGDGAICDVLFDQQMNFIATDLVDRGYVGQHGTYDFLKCEAREAKAVITNPPFNLAEPFIRHAKALDVEYVALLLKSTFWHAERRRRLFDFWKPARIYAMTWRPDFLSKGAPTMDCMWCVWDGDAPVDPTYTLLRKP